MSNYNGWTSEERYFANCPMCRYKVATKADDNNKKIK